MKTKKTNKWTKWMKVKYVTGENTQSFLSENLWKEMEKDIITLLAQQKEKLQEQYAHPTKGGYCCACGYDIAGFEEKLAQTKKETIDELVELARQLKLEYANTPLNKRGNGWMWINKLLEKAKLIKEKK